MRNIATIKYQKYRPHIDNYHNDTRRAAGIDVAVYDTQVLHSFTQTRIRLDASLNIGQTSTEQSAEYMRNGFGILVPRSSTPRRTKTIIMPNGVGILDSLYISQLFANVMYIPPVRVVDNLLKVDHETTVVREGEYLFQIVLLYSDQNIEIKKGVKSNL